MSLPSISLPVTIPSTLVQLDVGRVLPIAAVIFLLLLCAISPDKYLFAQHRKGIKEIPGALPLIGNLLQIACNKDRFLDQFLRLQKDIGRRGMPWAATLPSLGGRITVINRPEYIRWVQKTNFENYIKGPAFRQNLGDVLGHDGIFVADGQPWKKQRKMASHIFSVTNFRTHVQNTIHHDLDVLHDLMADASRRRSAIDLPDLFFRFTLSSFSLMAFSADVGCLPRRVEGLSQSVEFASHFDYAQRVMDERFVDPFARFTELFSPQGRKMRRSIKALHEFCYRIIDLRMQAKTDAHSMQSAAEKGGKDLLALFMDQNFTRQQLLPVVLNFIIAGRDTTAQTLAWLFYEFCKNPDKLERCRQEIDQRLGSGAEYRHMNYDDLGTLVYTQACFYEALRLHPSVPKNIKKAVKDDVIRPYASCTEPSENAAPNAVASDVPLPDLVISAGESVSWQDYVMARMPELWGADCEQFSPERFIDGSDSIKTYSPFLFHAFNAGPRLCLGQTLATYEAVAVVAEILAKFHVEFDHAAMANNEPTYQDSLTHPIRNPYSVGFTIRDE